MPLKIRYKAIIEYAGTHFYGWQIQKNQRTVQEEIYKLLKQVFNIKRLPRAAGRTDAGVHAEYQVIDFDLDIDIQPAKLKEIMNSKLPIDIGVKEIEYAHPEFDSRRDAISRTYEYRIKRCDYQSPFLKDRFHFVRDELDIKKLNGISQVFRGEHNFKAFSVTGTKTETYIRKVKEIEWFVKNNDTIIFRITADAFLRKMARLIISGIFMLYYNKISLEEIKNMLISGKRSKNITPYWPHGLYLVDIRYKNE
ncbi:MAG: tRNA pseudouridine(38-40) synthase TruA [Candidatus Hydrogenedentota bacterium]